MTPSEYSEFRACIDSFSVAVNDVSEELAKCARSKTPVYEISNEQVGIFLEDLCVGLSALSLVLPDLLSKINRLEGFFEPPKDSNAPLVARLATTEREPT